MPKLDSTGYTALFATAVSVVCALLVSVSAVLLQPRQEANQRLYIEKNVLLAAGLVRPGEDVTEAEVRKLFDEQIEMRLVDFAAGALLPVDKLDPHTYDQRKARKDEALSNPAPANRAGVQRLPKYGVVYFVKEGEDVKQVVVAIEGLGMWGTIYGFLALDRDANSVLGLTYYEQKETPGLGGEIANPKWQALWRGRRVYDESWEPRITVIKGNAGPPDKDPLRVDGLSGATVTSTAVNHLMAFWMSDNAYGRFLRAFREGAKT